MKNKKAKKKKKKIIPAQKHLLIGEIKNDTIVMRDGTLRAVLMVSSINFALKNEDEQNALVAAYVAFLNGLDHPLQIVVQSRRLQIKPYLEKLGEYERAQRNDLLRAQIADYRSFVNQLVELSEIMSKQFYVVVPYDPLSNKSKSFWARLKDVASPTNLIKLKSERFLKRKEDLDRRLRQVQNGLGSLGLTVARLDTQSLIELFYSTYNPDIALSEPLPDTNKIQVESE